MQSIRQVQDLIGKIYEAACDPTAWDGFLAALLASGHGTMAALIFHDSQAHQYDQLATKGMPEDYVRLWSEHYGEVDEWFKGGVGIIRTGWVGTSQALCPDSKLLKSEFYSDYLRPFDVFHQCGGILRQTGTSLSAITLLRPRRQGCFGHSHVSLLNALIPHLQRAMQLHQKFVDIGVRSRSLESGFDLLSIGVVFVDSQGRILLTNRRADALLARKDGILVRRQKLYASVYAESVRLQAVIEGSIKTRSSEGLAAGGMLLVSREKGRPLSVIVAPIRSIDLLMNPRSAALIFISDPNDKVQVPEDLLQQGYGLTPAEARLASILAQGYSLKEAAEMCRVTRNTVRSQLKIVFMKTGVQRQGELIRLLLTSSGFTAGEV
jgi:DNA-binding CsgD family transcriptional regulator